MGIFRDTERLNLTQSDSALAKAKLAEAKETLTTCALQEDLVLPLSTRAQDSAKAEISRGYRARCRCSDGILETGEQAAGGRGRRFLTDLGPARLDRPRAPDDTYGTERIISR